jgi:transcriptional regulator with XRE-family HTH domain
MGNRFPIGYKLNQARLEKGWTQADLAKKYGCSDAYIGLLETGHSSMGLKSIKKLSGILEKPLNYFLEDHTMQEVLPSEIPMIRRQLNELTGKYEILAKTLSFVEVKVMELETLPQDFTIAVSSGTIKIPREELGKLPESHYQNLFAVKLTTDIGDEWQIPRKSYVIIDHLSLHEKGLYLLTYQGMTAFRIMEWVDKKATMKDARGISVIVLERDLMISGRVLLYGGWKNPPSMG